MKTVVLSKADIRNHSLAKRNTASSEWREKASVDIARLALPLVAAGPGGPVAGYWPFKSEVDPWALMDHLQDYGRTLALPVITHPQMTFLRFIEGVDLVDAGFGTFGPDDTADILRPAIVLVPLAAFDSQCNRIGWGKGHYDRAIAQLKADGSPLLTVGVAFGFQQVDEIPVEPHDHPLDMVVTEQQIFQRG